MKSINSPELDELFRVILSLKDGGECYAFFSDLCTIKEMLDMAQRFQVAKQLEEGRSYTDISEKTGASSATIIRVNRCLKYSDGYRLALDRLKAEEDGKCNR